MTMSFGLIDFQAIDEPRKFSGTYLHCRFGIIRPAKSTFFKTLLPQAETILLPVKNFDHVPPAVTESEKMPSKWILTQNTTYHCRQTIDCFSHVDMADCNINFESPWKNHRPATMRTTFSNAIESKSREISIKALGPSFKTRPELAGSLITGAKASG